MSINIIRKISFFKKVILLIIFSIFIADFSDIIANLANLTRNDPFPLFSSFYPYNYLSIKQKANLMFFDYNYPSTNMRFSISGYRQFASFARDEDGNVANLGDVPLGRWNMLGLFYDPQLRDKLFMLLNINSAILPTVQCGSDKYYTDCYCLITDSNLSDVNKEFGFFTIPALYRKYGMRFETEFALISKCYYTVGLKFQIGVADVKQTPFNFSDLTCQALGTACPAYSSSSTITGKCADPGPAVPVAIPPKFTNTSGAEATTVPPCPTSNGPVTTGECVPIPQTFQPCCDSTLCMSYTAECKQIVINDIMKKRSLITKYLDIDDLRYSHVGAEDFRMYLFWRQIFVVNEETEKFPRLLFMPFLEVGAAMPLDIEVNSKKFFGLPVGNNGHLSTGLTFGGTLDFLDTIELIFQVGFTKFFPREHKNYRMPTSTKESGIFPYFADVVVSPGTTWFTGFGFKAYNFLDRLSVWLEYLIEKHREDDIKICKSYIPSTSIYYNQGFLVDYFRDTTRWGYQAVNAGFNYELSNNMTIGLLWQVAARERNSFRATTVMGTFDLVY